MSKMDNLRAMREAKYQQAASRAAKPTTASKKAKPTPTKAGAQPAAVDPEQAAEELCGHRAISGRTCTREAGHAAKNHRYS